MALQLLNISLLLFLLTGSISAFYKYESSYAFLYVQNEGTSERSGPFCVNFQNWRSNDLPDSIEKTKALRLAWWNAAATLQERTNICSTPRSDNFSETEIVPADYRTWAKELAGCRGKPGFNDTLRRPVKNQVEVMKAARVKNILFLIQKGKLNGYVHHDYLFTHFYNSEINKTESVNVFYVYHDTFQREILPLLGSESIGPNRPANIHVVQPSSKLPMDPAVAVLWLFSVFSILIGSLWAASDTRARISSKIDQESRTELTVEEGEANERQLQGNEPQQKAAGQSQMRRTQSTEIAQMSALQHCISVAVALFVVVFVLMAAFFFRQVAVFGFNIFLLIIGEIAVHSCLHALALFFTSGWDPQVGTLGDLLCCLRRRRAGRQTSQQALSQAAGDSAPAAGTEGGESTMSDGAQGRAQDGEQQERVSSSTNAKYPPLLERPLRLLSLLIHIAAASFCIAWFIVRDEYFAFLLLDPINLALCIFAIRSSRIRSLRLITFLLLAMFLYDLFMVFGTRLLTSDGCSVMLQVVTGMDCKPKKPEHSGELSQPIAPIEADLPEKIPLLFYVPMLADPVARCFDVGVEREFKHVMLGLGDVIVPGYLIAYCFYVDVVQGKGRHKYGLVSMIGYSLGMAATFTALLLMETGQPALIYLVPFTLIPICLCALADEKGTLKQMWRGEI